MKARDFFNVEAKRKHDEQFREHVRRKRRDQELEEITAREAKAARAARPIQVRRFEV